MPVRLLLTDYTKTFGGAPEHAVSLTKSLSAIEEAEVTFLSPQEALRQRIEGAGGKFRRLELADARLQKNEASGPLAKGAHLLKEWYREEFPAARQVVRVGRAIRADVVQLNNLPSFQRSAILGARVLCRPCIATHQGFESYSRSLGWILPHIRMHVAISGAIRKHILSLGVPEDQVRLIHDAIDTARFHPRVSPVDFAALFGFPRDAPTFGIVGRVIAWKGHATFLEVAAEVFRRIPEARAVVVGDVSDGDIAFEEGLRRRADELQISDKVVFAGRRNNVPEFMKALSVVLHLSREPEPLGLVVAEALAVGTPVVGMNEGGVPDMLKHGESGFLCSPDDVPAIAKAVEQLLQAPELRKQFGAVGAKEMAENFNGERCARQYSALYRELI